MIIPIQLQKWSQLHLAVKSSASSANQRGLNVDLKDTAPFKHLFQIPTNSNQKGLVAA